MIALHMETTLTEQGHLVQTARSWQKPKRRCRGGDVDVAVVDWHLIDGAGSLLVVPLRELGVPFVVCSGSGSLYEPGEVFQNTRVLPKPITTESLIEAVRTAGAEQCHVR